MYPNTEARKSFIIGDAGIGGGNAGVEVGELRSAGITYYLVGRAGEVGSPSPSLSLIMYLSR